MKLHLKHSVFLGIALLLLSLTSACSQKRGLGLQNGTDNGLALLGNYQVAFQAAEEAVNNTPNIRQDDQTIESVALIIQQRSRILSGSQASFYLANDIARVLGVSNNELIRLYQSIIQRVQQSNYNLRPAYVLSEITSGARVFAEGDQVYLTGSGEGFGIFSFSAGYFMSGKAALQQGLAQGVNLFSSTNTRSVRSMAKAGNYLFISSDSGLFQFDVSNPSRPYIYRALPNSGSSGLNVSAFQWNGMVYEPQTNRLLGFQGNRLYSMGVSDQTPSSSSLGFNIGCGRGAALFRGKIYVAGCDQLWVMNPDTYSGGFQAGLFSKQINAQAVAATANYLYVYHAPINGSGAVNVRAGVYVFDQSENQVNFINLPRLNSFTVSGDDRFIIANDNDARAAIFRIPWTR